MKKESDQAERGDQVQPTAFIGPLWKPTPTYQERAPVDCICGGGMTERYEKNRPYQACKACGRVYAPMHRPEGTAPLQTISAKKSRLAAASSSQSDLF